MLEHKAGQVCLGGRSISYSAPHQLRQGHSACAFSLARDTGERQAIRQNLMHRKRDIKDAYIWLSEAEVLKPITNLTNPDDPMPMCLHMSL